MLVYGDCAVNVDPTPEELSQVSLYPAMHSCVCGLGLLAWLTLMLLDAGVGSAWSQVSPRVPCAPLLPHCFPVQIATVSADTAASFGITPRVAMMSYSTGTSGSGPQVRGCCLLGWAGYGGIQGTPVQGHS